MQIKQIISLQLQDNINKMLLFIKNVNFFAFFGLYLVIISVQTSFFAKLFKK